MAPQTQYARSGDVNVAYQVFGEGPIDLVVVPGWISCIETFWEDPGFTRFLQRLGSFARVASLAPPDTVLVSQTAKDLVAGSGLAFDDFGVHPLKGIPDTWHLYSVKSAPAGATRR